MTLYEIRLSRSVFYFYAGFYGLADECGVFFSCFEFVWSVAYEVYRVVKVPVVVHFCASFYEIHFPEVQAYDYQVYVAPFVWFAACSASEEYHSFYRVVF